VTLDVRWAKLAQRDFDEMDDYYAAISPDVALDIGRKLLAATHFLTETPKAGPVLGDGPRRKWTVKGTPYLLVYRAHPGYIRILRVRHVREDWKPRPF
jgi:toxin ParE1/3/4